MNVVLCGRAVEFWTDGDPEALLVLWDFACAVRRGEIRFPAGYFGKEFLGGRLAVYLLCDDSSEELQIWDVTEI
jgi:hypothetical protein